MARSGVEEAGEYGARLLGGGKESRRASEGGAVLGLVGRNA